MRKLTKPPAMAPSRGPLRLAPALLGGLFLLAAVPALRAQEDDQKGVDQGNYTIKQSIEFGGRLTSLSGNSQVYDTFVNLHDGPRLLNFTTEMQSINHRATFFDRLYFSNFGYGGDPNNVSRLRISKNKRYNFDALFRRDENFWDYSLLANPLNPAAPPFANAPAGFTPVIGASPHRFNTRRRTGDYSLLLFPESRVRLRLGYSPGVVEGPSFNTIHQGTEQLLFQEWKSTSTVYRLGLDYRLLPRTNISYDQIFNYYKGDTGRTDNNQLFSLANGQLVDLGVSLNAGANQPCAATFQTDGFVNPACSAYLSYLQNGRTRTNTRTEQLALQSNYWTKLDLSARVSYSSGDTRVFGYDETLAGRESRTGLRNQTTTGPVFGRRVAAGADLGMTWHVNDRLSFADSLHYLNWHNPVEFDPSTCSFFSPNLLTTARVFTSSSALPVNCVSPADALAGTPAHTASSAPDISLGLQSQFLKQDEKTNLAELDYRFSQRLGGRIGYRYRHRAIDDRFRTSVLEVFFPSNANRGDCALVAGNLPEGCTANGDGSFTFATPDLAVDQGETVVNEHAALVGFWARPIPSWRISFDSELMVADNTFTRIAPEKSQEYRFRTSYKPGRMRLNGSVVVWHGTSHVPENNHKEHNYAVGVSALFEPTDKIEMEIGYDYNDVFSQILICYTSSTAPKGLAGCPGAIGLVQQLSTYSNVSHYGYINASWTPFRRITAHLGASLTGTSGSADLLAPNAVPGSLNSKYLHPSGGIDYRFVRNFTGKAYWDYYGYHEDPAAAPQDIFAPRNFRGNLVTLSLRYAF